MMLKNDVKKLVLEEFKGLRDQEVKKVVNMFYELQGLYIEVVERQQLKGGRTIYGGFPYALLVSVYDIKKVNDWKVKGSGIITGDYAAHKGIGWVALDCIGEYYGIDRGVYLLKWDLLKKLNIMMRIVEKGYNGRYEKEVFKWYDNK